jgi:hypothetical protein
LRLECVRNAIVLRMHLRRAISHACRAGQWGCVSPHREDAETATFAGHAAAGAVNRRHFSRYARPLAVSAELRAGSFKHPSKHFPEFGSQAAQITAAQQPPFWRLVRRGPSFGAGLLTSPEPAEGCDRRSPARQETCGRGRWLGRETGHSATAALVMMVVFFVAFRVFEQDSLEGLAGDGDRRQSGLELFGPLQLIALNGELGGRAVTGG